MSVLSAACRSLRRRHRLPALWQSAPPSRCRAARLSLAALLCPGPQPRHRLRGRHRLGGPVRRRSRGGGPRRASAAPTRGRQDPGRRAGRLPGRARPGPHRGPRDRRTRCRPRWPRRPASRWPTSAVSTVGPSWGDEITEKAQRALVCSSSSSPRYIAWRLEWKMAVGALASVVHDIIISVGFYALFAFEVTPATVIAFLTILGYSLYDTIVVFDQMQENAEQLGATGKMTYTEHGQPLAQPGADALGQHHHHLAAAGAVDALRRLVPAGRGHPPGVRPRPRRRPRASVPTRRSSSPRRCGRLKEREPRYREIRARAAARSGPGRTRSARPPPAPPAAAPAPTAGQATDHRPAQAPTHVGPAHPAPPPQEGQAPLARAGPSVA